MGPSSSKQKDGAKPQETRKQRKQKQKSNPRHAGSTESFDFDHSLASSFTAPNNHSQPEETQSLSDYHSSEDLTGQVRPVDQPQTNLPPDPMENSLNIPPQLQTVEDLQGHAIQSLPARNTPTPVPNRETLNRRLDILGR